MEGKLSRKRPLDDFDDDETNKPPREKRVRFPKGKKVKPGEELTKDKDTKDRSGDLSNPRRAATERAKHRNQFTTELFNEDSEDVSKFEVQYADNENFVDDGIQMDPFNLDQEREEGYFDDNGNYVEYVNQQEVKDAWLDSIEVNPRYAGKSFSTKTKEDENGNDTSELSSGDIAAIKRRIANVLEDGETVLQALRRLKGSSNDKKNKMPAETQLLFDQLTEDANKLLDHGEYNVYHDKQEVFQNEAEGYERLALARGEGTSLQINGDNSNSNTGTDLFSSIMNPSAASSVLTKINGATSTPNVSKSTEEEFDMFADDDDKPNTSAHAGSDSSGVGQPVSDGPSAASETGAVQNDYIYDETSGYYYNSSLGYYYDPSTGLYCCASSGQWYSFNEQTGAYDEVRSVAPTET